MNSFVHRLGIPFPLVQSPMAGVSTPALAAAVINAGGLGSIAVGNLDAEAARRTIAELRRLTNGPFNVNVFCHRPAGRDALKEEQWLERLAPMFARFHATRPERLHEIYRSYVVDEQLQVLLLAERPTVVSFHFGLPAAEHIHLLRARGSMVLATITNLSEALAAEEACVDAVVAQGFEAGGHRGVFDPNSDDECLSTRELIVRLQRDTKLPIIAAGGIMDAKHVSAAFEAGASAVQVGTAFLLCPEVSIDAGYRSAIESASTRGTVMTRVISGRPARSIVGEFTRFGDALESQDVIPNYPIAYDAGKALRAAAIAAGNHEFGAHWAGGGVRECRAVPAAEVVAKLMSQSPV